MPEPVTIGVRVLAVELREHLLWNYKSLRAPYWRFYWNLSGNATITFETRGLTREMQIEPHRPYLIPPDTDFSAKVEGPIDHLFVHFTLENDRTPAHGVLEPEDPGAAPLTEAQIAGLVAAVRDEAPTAAHLAAAVVLLALGGLRPELVSAEPDDEAVRAAVAHVEANLHRPVHASELSRVAACGERTLRRRFHEAFGCTPAAYATRRRVERACILLHFSDRSIDEVAEETGFCDRFHFTRVFTQSRGMSPARFRKAREELSNSGEVSPRLAPASRADQPASTCGAVP